MYLTLICQYSVVTLDVMLDSLLHFNEQKYIGSSSAKTEQNFKLNRRVSLALGRFTLKNIGKIIQIS